MSGASPPLLLLHGALATSAQFDTLRPLLAERFTMLPALDFAGHGATPLDGEFGIAPFASQAEALLERAVAEAGTPASLFGYSMGGYVALAVARRRPELVSRVATLGTKFAWSAESAAREVGMLDLAKLREKVPRFAEALERLHAGIGLEPLLGQTAAMMHALGAHPILDAPALASIAQPVRVMVGDRDATVGVDESLATVRALAAGELEVLPRTPHPLERAPLARLSFSLIEFLAA